MEGWRIWRHVTIDKIIPRFRHLGFEYWVRAETQENKGYGTILHTLHISTVSGAKGHQLTQLLGVFSDGNAHEVVCVTAFELREPEAHPVDLLARQGADTVLLTPLRIGTVQD